MKKIILILTILGITLNAYAQHEHHGTPVKKEKKKLKKPENKINHPNTEDNDKTF